MWAQSWQSWILHLRNLDLMLVIFSTKKFAISFANIDLLTCGGNETSKLWFNNCFENLKSFPWSELVSWMRFSQKSERAILIKLVLTFLPDLYSFRSCVEFDEHHFLSAFLLILFAAKIWSLYQGTRCLWWMIYLWSGTCLSRTYVSVLW